MATMFGRFEVQSELSKSDTALIYKVMDTTTNQVVALKTQSLALLGKRAERFVDTLIREGESTRDLVCQNIALLYGAGEIDGQFCAAMEYIQGNSVASMLAHREGFSIWDLLDITRQVCTGLEHAAAKNLAHSSLEPAKIMVQWDGTVKILGYGISNMSLIEAEAGKSLGRLMPYCSPEQIRGEAIDLRSNIFTLGTILYEMVGGRKAFDGGDPVALVNQIEHEMPAELCAVNPKIQSGVSAVIMKALAKDPADRYSSVREFVQELEACKESGKKAAGDSKATVQAPAPAPPVAVNSAAHAVESSKIVSGAAAGSSITPSLRSDEGAASRANALATEVAAGMGAARESSIHVGMKVSSGFISNSDSKSNSKFNSKLNSKPSARQVGEYDVHAPEYQAARLAVMSAAPVEHETVPRAPTVAVDPMMAPVATGSSGKRFSDLTELPPLKDVALASPTEEAAEALPSNAQIHGAQISGSQINESQINSGKEENSSIQPREVARKAIREIATIPPQLVLYAILGAVGLILIIGMALFFHVRSEDKEALGTPQPTKAVEVTSTASPPPEVEPAAPQIEKALPPTVEVHPNLKARQVKKAAKAPRPVAAPAPTPVAVPGEALIDSSPQGAQFQVDQASDAAWVTPFTLTGLSPGKHIIAISKAGYSSEVRSVDVVSGTRASLVLHLSPVNALMIVNSVPTGADVIIDGKATGHVTPAQFAVEKGSHTVLLRKQGYLDETVAADLSPGQNFQCAPVLKALGNVSEMRTVGKLSKLFSRGGESTAGMGSISVHTQPKGAQVAINQSILDRTSPVEVMVGPGNYIVDVTLTGFKPVHKVVNIEKGGKAAVDAVLERQ
jgi:serine/threonine protein kinase